MDIVTIIGIGASVFTSSALLPQLIRIIREKKADDVSTGMLIVLFIGLILWICYGGLKNDVIIIIANLFSLIITVITLILTVKYKRAS